MSAHDAVVDRPYVKEETLLALDRVSLKYGDRTILRDVSAEVQNITRPGVEQGQVVCFLGPSGIGKTQLSRLIAGLHTPTSGTIRLSDGKAPTPGAVGLVSQHYPLFPYMTVRENLHVAARQAGMTASAASIRFTKHCADLSLDSRVLSQYPKQLSGGQRQRVAIIRQLLCSEHFLILDEPFSGLDIKAKRQACRLIADVAQLHTLNTIIVITHDVTEGMSVADTVWLMGLGNSEEAGATIVEQYDLAAMGLAWQPTLDLDPRFLDAVQVVKRRFLEVAP